MVGQLMGQKLCPFNYLSMFMVWTLKIPDLELVIIGCVGRAGGGGLVLIVTGTWVWNFGLAKWWHGSGSAMWRWGTIIAGGGTWIVSDGSCEEDEPLMISYRILEEHEIELKMWKK